MSEWPSSYIAQEWSVHAQLTISHHRPDVEVTPATPQSDDGVHLEYSWNTLPPPCYGFQRGNIVFTTRPSSMSVVSVEPGAYGSLPARRPVQQQAYNRRCKSTCSITLSTDHLHDEGGGRSRSLDPPPPPVLEVCEVCGGDRSPSSVRRGANFTTHFCTRVPDKNAAKQSQDAASQTLDVVEHSQASSSTTGNKLYTKRKSVTDLLQIPSLDVPEAVEEDTTDKPTKRLSRSPARLSGKSPMIASRKSSSRSPEEATHKPRTVHIDVYCTGDSSSSSSSLDSDAGASWSSPQTVFESDEVRVVHTRAGRDRLPPAMHAGYDSEDGLSSQYPSRFSSYTSCRDPSSSTLSSSSCAPSDATSWKDTATDIDSILQSNLSLAQSDSFEYADSVDRLRIKERERAWASVAESKTWRSPQSERRQLMQQHKLWTADKSDESDDDDDDGDETGDAWSFGGGSSSRVSTLKREDTVRKATPATLTTQPPPAPAKVASSVTSPFTPLAGLRTDQLSRAERFGVIVGAFRKPGHHVGPSKNTDCGCAHCRSHFLELDACRGRTRSLDISLEAADSWKTQLQRQIAARRKLANSDEQWDDSTAV